MNFGDRITDIRVNKKWSLRVVLKRLKTISTSTYSKIERGIQNPYTKEEFNEIMEALEITDEDLIKELELLAMKYIPEKELTEEEFVKHLPAFLPPDFDESKLDKLKEIVKDTELPNPPKKK